MSANDAAVEAVFVEEDKGVVKDVFEKIIPPPFPVLDEESGVECNLIGSRWPVIILLEELAVFGLLLFTAVDVLATG